jgi:hypothetical protein
MRIRRHRPPNEPVGNLLAVILKAIAESSAQYYIIGNKAGRSSVSNLFQTKESMTIAQLTRGWGNELAKDGEDPKQKEQDLLYILREDIINGHLDNSGPLWDGRRLGVAYITPENKAGFAEGKFFLDLARADPGRFLHYVLIMKEAVLDFARRHRLPPPSWWTDSDETPALSSSVTTSHVAADSAKAPLSSSGKQPRIIKYLAERFPNGVPKPPLQPRNILKDDVLRGDPTLRRLDEATLKKAIDTYNASLGKKN